MKKIFLIILSTICIYADTYSFAIDNDGIISKEDSHYTNGLFFVWMRDKNSSYNFNFLNDLKTNNAISFSHLIFTPKDKTKSTPILNDIPYAGYAKLNLLLYKSTNNYFHEFGINIGVVGPITGAKELQSNFHLLTGHSKPKGWDTQLGNRAMYGISYGFGKKSFNTNIGRFKFDWTNYVRGDLGRFYSGLFASSTIRFGTDFANSFCTTENFIGADESNLLNFKEIKSFNYSIDFGIFANRVFNYYIVDQAINQGYNLPNIDYILGDQISFNIYYKKVQFAFAIKSINVYNSFSSNQFKRWGEFKIVWRY